MSTKPNLVPKEKKPMTIDPMFSRNPKEAERLAQKHIAIIGLGSFGGIFADMAVRLGVGKLTLVDPDTLAIENLARHVLSRPALNQPKVRGVKAALKSINPNVEVHAIVDDFRNMRPENILNGKHLDLVIGATDSFSCNSKVNDLSLARKIPAVYAACWGEADCGEILYVVPDKTPCFECYAAFRRDTAPAPVPSDEKYTNPNYDDTRLPGQAGLWPNILTICGIAFQLVLALLDPEGDRAQNLLDYERTLFLMNVSAYDLPLQPLAVTFGTVKKGCAVCDESKLGELGADLPDEVSTRAASMVGDENSAPESSLQPGGNEGGSNS